MSYLSGNASPLHVIFLKYLCLTDTLEKIHSPGEIRFAHYSNYFLFGGIFEYHNSQMFFETAFRHIIC